MPGVGCQEVPAYRNAKLPVEERVAELMGRMTLEEKVAQMEGTWQNRQQ
jgi:beta-glucosidase